MWVLLEEPKTETRINSELLVQLSQRKWGLVPGSMYRIGRLEGDIVCTDDSSVSKKHATISVISRSPQSRPEVILEDLGSKYGTHLNDGIIAESQRLVTSRGVSRALKKPQVMSSGDRFRFGVAFSIFRLKWIDLEVTASMLRDRAERSNLAGWLEAVGTKLQDSMTDKTSHLVMSNISLSIKVVNCLAKGVPIVTSEYFRDLGTCIKTRQPLPCERKYVPPVSNNSSETILRDPNISFDVNLNRAKLLDGIRIIFLDAKQFKQNRITCQLAGADVILWTEDMDIGSITREDVVIKPSGVSNKVTWSDFSSRLTSLSLAPCPHTDLYLAIVHCSTENYCNPSRRSKLIGGPTSVPDGNMTSGHKILAAETCSVSGTPGVKGSSEAVNSSVQVPKLGETQVLGTSSRPKRPRSSQEDEDKQQPPAKLANINSKSQSDALSRSLDDIFATNGDKENVSEGDKVSSQKDNFKSPVKLLSSSKQVESQEKISNKEDEEDEDDIFGFGGLQTKKKRPLSSPEKIQLDRPQQKRPRQEEGTEDNLFGFEEVKKEPPPSEEKMSERLSVAPEDTSGQIVNREKSNETRSEQEYVEFPSKIVQSSDGYIEKPDIKVELKDDSDVSALSVTVAMISLLRPSSSKPSYVEHPSTKQHGRPVANFKKFKKQPFDKPRTVIALKTHEPGDLDQTRIQDWFTDNKVVTEKENQAEETLIKAEEFWDFERSQGNKIQTQRKTNPFARSKR